MTIKEIARLAGVSISTVSKVMNRKDSSISPETRERVLRIIKEFNYTPYSNSHITNNTSKSYTIGVLVRNVEKTGALRSIMQAARSYGYTVLVSECADQPDLEFRGVTALCRHGVDGVLWEPLNEDSLKYIESFHTSKIPFILFNSNRIENALNMDYKRSQPELRPPDWLSPVPGSARRWGSDSARFQKKPGRSVSPPQIPKEEHWPIWAFFSKPAATEAPRSPASWPRCSC